jgi:hypothetical protein
MTDWKSLQDTNPEPSLLDAIAHAEEQQLEDRRSLHNFINAWAKANGVPVVDVPMSDLPMLFEMPRLKGEDK